MAPSAYSDSGVAILVGRSGSVVASMPMETVNGPAACELKGSKLSALRNSNALPNVGAGCKPLSIANTSVSNCCGAFSIASFNVLKQIPSKVKLMNHWKLAAGWSQSFPWPLR